MRIDITTGFILAALILIPVTAYGGMVTAEELVSGMEKAYSDPDFRERAGDCARELISRGSEAVPSILRALEEDDLSESAQSALCYVLGEINDQQASARLITLLDRKDVAAPARIRISKLLERWDEKEAIQAMLGIIQDKSEERNLRIVNIRILGRWQAASALAILTRIASDEEDELFVRYKAIQILEQYDQPDASSALIGLLRKPIKGRKLLAERAIIALGKKKDQDAVDALIELSQIEISPILIKRCVLALGEIGDAKAVPALEKLLKSEEPMIRDYSAQVLEKITGGKVETPERTTFPESQIPVSRILTGPAIATE